MKQLALLLLASFSAASASALTVEPIRYGDMNSWVTRHIKESAVIGGNSKTLYEVGPARTIEGNKAYSNLGGSPWATSNVYAKVSGVTKGSNAVYPADHPGAGKCAKLATEMQSIKVLGMVNMDVMVAGSMFLGQILEPISSTKNPYAKMDMGVPYAKRPQALVFDFKVDMPKTNTRTKSSGFGSKKTLPGRDHAVAFVMLQRRWEEPDGSIHAKRVATGCEKFTSAAPWNSNHSLPLIYGNPTGKPGYDPMVVGLKTGANAYYARNSKGKMVPVIEEGWDDASATPTHAIVMFSAGGGEPYVGTEGLTFYVDNVGFGF
ncbi:MAG: glycoside hydrolase xylanase [Bacteroides sp.]|nr:glycoside hydrolase xylanase [Bacteroidales bacterium]MBD5317116.1 glycoside hydrolase xylanase [Bacteroides sp.]